MEELSAQNSRAAHDRRHFNNVLMKLLEQEKTGEAAALLQSRGMTMEKKPLSRILMLCIVLTPLPWVAYGCGHRRIMGAGRGKLVRGLRPDSRCEHCSMTEMAGA
jgi:hypothetical protein